jgi:uncharacterized membrane protein YcfT
MSSRPPWPPLSEAVTQPLPRVLAAPPRAAWTDVAKGACILLAVMCHVIMKHHL